MNIFLFIVSLNLKDLPSIMINVEQEKDVSFFTVRSESPTTRPPDTSVEFNDKDARVTSRCLSNKNKLNHS